VLLFRLFNGLRTGSANNMVEVLSKAFLIRFFDQCNIFECKPYFYLYKRNLVKKNKYKITKQTIVNYSACLSTIFLLILLY
jgi:hypothetical protein